MSDENPYQPPATPIPRLPRPTAEHAEPIPFHKAILDHWALLFRSRARHLLQIYTNSIRAVDPTTTGTMTLDQARTRWEQLRTGPALSEAERDTFESQMGPRGPDGGRVVRVLDVRAPWGCRGPFAGELVA